MTTFSYQLYSSRRFGPLDDTLSLLAKAGYGEVEGYGGLFADLDAAGLTKLRSALDAHGLAMRTGHIGLDEIETNPGHVVDIARALGIKTVYCPYLMPAERPKDAAGWDAFATRLDRAGQPLRNAGLRFGWHNHDPEFRALPDGSLPIEHILASPELEWEADIAWIVRGGSDAFPWIERFKRRITAVHVKDIAPAGEKTDEDGWSDVGTGIVPWSRLFAALRETAARHYVMEHDNPSDDARFARASIVAARSY